MEIESHMDLIEIPFREFAHCPICGSALRIDQECEVAYKYCPGEHGNKSIFGEDETATHFSMECGSADYINGGFESYYHDEHGIEILVGITTVSNLSARIPLHKVFKQYRPYNTERGATQSLKNYIKKHPDAITPVVIYQHVPDKFYVMPYAEFQQLSSKYGLERF